MAALAPSAVFQRMAAALPAPPPADPPPALATAHEAVALLVHAALAALDFALLGFDEDSPLPEAKALAPRLPARWNAAAPALAFVYAHKQSSMRFVVRVDRLGPRVDVRALAVGHNRICRLGRAVADLVRPDALPLRAAPDTDAVRAVFVSDSAVADLLRDLQVRIVQQLIPNLQKDGYAEIADADADARADRRAAEARNPNRPFAGPAPDALPPLPGPLPAMARPRPSPVADFPPPGFEDEYDMNRPPRAPLVLPPGRSPFNIGHDDLNPPGLAPHDPLRGSLAGGVPRPAGPSGMHPTLDDPLFAGDPGAAPAGFDSHAPPGAGPRFGPRGGGFGGDII